ncbi:hypothetical protein KAOT1_01659 [Kordia algicida OT-1]|uniref:Uncharacterized protein n=2 Tax=Kordia TaxID=221065 RepID=A9E6B0_9FLAO|nr:hypothetical protein KAOT1_01659 [Kordia algicida OT-1]
MFAMFSISVSAHQETKSFQSQFGTTLTQHTTAYTSMYTMNNGGIIQLIYNVFNKVGHALYATMNTSEGSKEEETTSIEN